MKQGLELPGLKEDVESEIQQFEEELVKKHGQKQKDE